jgi:hypothetical protein
MKSIAAIGKIVSLEQLRLSAWIYGGLPHWLIDHDEMRSHLGTLSNLKKLAISGETYETYGFLHEAEYYSAQLMFGSEQQDAEARPEMDENADHGNGGDKDGDEHSDRDVYEALVRLNPTWERAHRNRMLTQAEKYAATLPSLEWIYCGQLPMDIRDPGNGASKVAVPLTKKRGGGLVSFENLFAMGHW